MKKPLLFTFVITVVLLALLLAVKYGGTALHGKGEAPDALAIPATSASLQKNLTVFMAQLETKVKTGPASDSSVILSALIPRGKPLEWIVWYLSQAVNNTPYQIQDCIYSKKNESCRFYFAAKDPALKRIVLTIAFSGRFLSTTAKIAIIVNMADSSLTETDARDFIIFPEPLTLGLWPHDSLSSELAKQADDFHKELVIFLPLESTAKVPNYYAPGLILIHFPEAKIRAGIAEGVRIIPQFAGIGNLFGSRALEDSRVMGIILQEARERHAYFIETQTTGKSVVSGVAGSIGLPFAVVQTSIQELQQIDKIDYELQRCMAAAHIGGKIIISVTATKPVATALADVLPVLKQNGIKLVFVSELVNHPEEK
jgi:uncharacterized protein